MPKVSVIVPVYNSESTLSRCLDSILAQDLQDFEILCINDGSTDGSQSILESYEKQDDRVKQLYKVNEGVSKARNTAIKIACGDYILFVDSDDHIAPDMISRLALSIESGCDIAVCGYTEINNERQIEVLDYISCKDKDDFILNCIQNTGGVVCSKMYRSSLLKEHNLLFDESLVQSEDLIFALQAMIYAERLSQIDYCGYFYDRRNENKRNTDLVSLLNKNLIVHDRILDILSSCTVEGKDEVLKSRLENIIYVYLRSLAESKGLGEFRDAYSGVRDRIADLSCGSFDFLNRTWLRLYMKKSFRSSYLICKLRSALAKIRNKVK